MRELSSLSLKDAWTDIRALLTRTNIIRYVLGMSAIGLGVAPMIRSNIGVSSWDTLNYSLHSLIPGIPFGLASGITATTVMILTILLYRNAVYLVMAVPIVLVSAMILLFDQVVFAQLVYTAPWQHILGFTFGLLLLPLGGSLMISTHLPAGVYDEFMLAVLHVAKSSNIPLVRAIIELTVVLLALMLGAFAGIGAGKINVGTLVFSLMVGVLIRWYLTFLERLGQYEPQQMD